MKKPMKYRAAAILAAVLVAAAGGGGALTVMTAASPAVAAVEAKSWSASSAAEGLTSGENDSKCSVTTSGSETNVTVKVDVTNVKPTTSAGAGNGGATDTLAYWVGIGLVAPDNATGYTISGSGLKEPYTQDTLDTWGSNQKGCGLWITITGEATQTYTVEWTGSSNPKTVNYTIEMDLGDAAIEKTAPEVEELSYSAETHSLKITFDGAIPAGLEVTLTVLNPNGEEEIYTIIGDGKTAEYEIVPETVFEGQYKVEKVGGEYVTENTTDVTQTGEVTQDKVDTAALEKAIADAKAALADETKNYTEESAAEKQAAVDAAEALLDKVENSNQVITQEEIDGAAAAIAAVTLVEAPAAGDNETTGGDDTAGDNETTGGDDTAGDDETTGGDDTAGDDETTGGDDTAGDNETTGGSDTAGEDSTTDGAGEQIDNPATGDIGSLGIALTTLAGSGVGVGAISGVLLKRRKKQ